MRQAGTRTVPARANSDRGTRDRMDLATRAPAMARPRQAGQRGGDDPGQWGRAVLDSLARVPVGMAPDIPAARTVRGDAEHAGQAAGRRLSRPRDSPSQAAGQAASARCRAAGLIPAPARPDPGIGRAAP